MNMLSEAVQDRHWFQKEGRKKIPNCVIPDLSLVQGRIGNFILQYRW